MTIKTTRNKRKYCMFYFFCDGFKKYVYIHVSYQRIFLDALNNRSKSLSPNMNAAFEIEFSTYSACYGWSVTSHLASHIASHFTSHLIPNKPVETNNIHVGYLDLPNSLFHGSNPPHAPQTSPIPNLIIILSQDIKEPK